MKCDASRWVMILLGLGALGGCQHAKREQAATPVDWGRPEAWEGNLENWIGAYSSPGETGGFSGTALLITHPFESKKIQYKMSYYRDVRNEGEIEESEKSGQLLAEGDELFLPEASGYMRDGKVSLRAYIERYTRVRINGRTVLMRDDALREYREHDRLYDYGILIKVSEAADIFTDLEKVKHESVKVLYKDPKKEWKDPFVNGGNER
jgi:hypothetical protein